MTLNNGWEEEGEAAAAGRAERAEGLDLATARPAALAARLLAAACLRARRSVLLSGGVNEGRALRPRAADLR
jgi:hypothetical protein